MILFDKLLKEREIILFNTKAKYISSIDNYDKKLEQIKNGLIGNNKFITEYNFIEKEFTNKFNIKECLGYSNEEFTIRNTNNNYTCNTKIIHEDDVKHKIRYDHITYMLITKAYSFEALKDYYKLIFRIRHKNGSIIKVERSVFLFRMTPDGMPFSQLDVWEVSQNNTTYVTPSYYTPNYQTIMKDFYKLNSEILKIKFTNKEKEILSLKDKQLHNKEIANLLNINSVRTVEKHIENMKIKVENFYMKENIKKEINSAYEVLNFAKEYGLYPYY